MAQKRFCPHCQRQTSADILNVTHIIGSHMIHVIVKWMCMVCKRINEQRYDL